MKWGLILVIIILMSFSVSALNSDLSKSKYSSDVFKIKFDDAPISMNYNLTKDYWLGCNSDGRLFIKFEVNSEVHQIKDIDLRYKAIGVPIPEQELTGKYYRRNMQTGIFEEIDNLFTTYNYFFWSDSLLDEHDYKIVMNNLDGKHEEKIDYIHCPKFKYTCEDFKPIINCYNTNDEKLVIEMSNININDKESFSLRDMNIYTKGTNERANVLDNTLASDAKMTKVGDKYIIVSSLLYGNPNAGTNIINYVHLQPKSCFFDMYPDAYVAQKCEGLKDVSSTSILNTNAITGDVVVDGETEITSYWVYGVALIVVVILIALVIRRKKTI